MCAPRRPAKLMPANVIQTNITRVNCSAHEKVKEKQYLLTTLPKVISVMQENRTTMIAISILLYHGVFVFNSDRSSRLRIRFFLFLGKGKPGPEGLGQTATGPGLQIGQLLLNFNGLFDQIGADLVGILVIDRLHSLAERGALLVGQLDHGHQLLVDEALLDAAVDFIHQPRS